MPRLILLGTGAALTAPARENTYLLVEGKTTATEPAEGIVELARGCTILLHEATTLETPAPGHSSAIQAGSQARRAAAGKLVLVHLPPDTRPAKWRAAARKEFAGPIVVGRDFQSFVF